MLWPFQPFGHYVVMRCPLSAPKNDPLVHLCEFLDDAGHRMNTDGIWFKNNYCWECWRNHNCTVLNKVIRY